MVAPRRLVISSYPGRCAAALFVVSLASAAHAGPEETLRAESLFRSGKAALQRGDHETACPQLAESQRLQPAGGTLLALALCHESWGKNATAWALFQEAEAMARAQGRSDRAAIARTRALALEAGLSFMTIEFDGGGAASAEVFLDGLRVGEAALGAQTAVNIGAHQVEARRDGKVYFARSFELAAGETLKVVVPAPPAETPTPTPPPTAAQPALDGLGAVSPPPAVPVASERKAGSSAVEQKGALARYGPPAVLAVGLATLLVGGYFGVRAWQGAREVEQGCHQDPCQASLQTVHETSKRDAARSNWLVGVGVAATGLGAYLTVRSAKVAEARVPASSWGVAAGPQRAEFSWSGSF